jgi:hypothetical protein
MASKPTSVSPLGDEPNASRRGFVAAAATIAAAAGAASSCGAVNVSPFLRWRRGGSQVRLGLGSGTLLDDDLGVTFWRETAWSTTTIPAASGTDRRVEIHG